MIVRMRLQDQKKIATNNSAQGLNLGANSAFHNMQFLFSQNATPTKQIESFDSKVNQQIYWNHAEKRNFGSKNKERLKTLAFSPFWPLTFLSLFPSSANFPFHGVADEVTA